MDNSSANSQLEVATTARHTLQCANQSSLAKLSSPFRPGPFDSLIEPIVPIAVVFIYQAPSMVSRELIPHIRLKKALEILLDHYPHLTGRLHIEDRDGKRTIDGLGTGAELLEATCNSPLSAFSSQPQTNVSQPDRNVGTQLPGAGNALLPPSELSVEAACRDPLFAIQHTRFACGSVALGVRLAHFICDAEGFFQLVRHLAEVYRALRAQEYSNTHAPIALTRPPQIIPYLANPSDLSDQERRNALEFQPTLYSVSEVEVSDFSLNNQQIKGEPTQESTRIGQEKAVNVTPATSPRVVGRVLRFSGKELETIKARATDSEGGGWISTFDALSAYLAQRIYRARLELARASSSSGANSLVTDILTSVNIRRPLGLSSSAYFPNALFTPSIAPPHDSLAFGELHETAKIIHDLTHSPETSSLEEVRRTVAWIASQPDPRKVKAPFRFGPGSFMISQWNKFGMYSGVDFDVAEDTNDVINPSLVWPPFTPIWLLCDGLAYFLSTEDKSDTAAIDVNLSLSEPVWETLAKSANLSGGI